MNKKLKIAFQGEPGANSHIAIAEAYPDAEPMPCPTFEDALAAISSGEADLGMIPIENSVAGRVADIHHLLPASGLFIVGEWFLPIRHQLMALKGVKLADIKSVESHVQALGQCRRTIRKLGIKPIVAGDTAGSARDVSERGDRTVAAIASRLAAEIYGLDILAEDIEDEAHNTTRFVVLAREAKWAAQGSGPLVTSFVFRVRNLPAALYKALGGFATNGVNMTKLESYMVDGVFTADPRKVPTARLVPAITPEEAAELTYYGSEVIHPFTMEQAIKKSVPIRIKNVENPTGCGTVIFPDHASAHNPDDVQHDPFVDGHVEQPQPPASRAHTPGTQTPVSGSEILSTPAVPPLANRKRRLPTAVTIKDNIIVLNVHSNRKTISHGFFARIFGTLDRYGVVVDLISTSEVHVSMAMTADIKPRTLERLSAELEHVGVVSVLRSMVILSLVGKEMRHMVGVAGRMFSTLAEGNINIEMISQGANEINISCVIHERAALKALNLIHYSILELSPKPCNMEGGTFGRSFF